MCVDTLRCHLSGCLSDVCVCVGMMRGHLSNVCVWAYCIVRLSIRRVWVGTLHCHLSGCLSDGYVSTCYIPTQCAVTCQAVCQMGVCAHCAVTCQAACQTYVCGHVMQSLVRLSVRHVCGHVALSLVRLSVRHVCVGTLHCHLSGYLSDVCVWARCAVTCQAVCQTAMSVHVPTSWPRLQTS